MIALLLAMLTASPAAEAELQQTVLRVLEARTPAQQAFLESRAPEVAYLGRRYGGKSFVLCMKALMVGDVFGPPRFPKARIFLCREERASMTQTTVWTMREEVLGPNLWAALYHAGDDELRMPNGSTIAFTGLDQPKRILGARYMWIGIDQAEQLDEDQFTIVQSGAMQDGFPWTQVALAFNPDAPDSWPYQRFQPDLGDGKRYWDDGRHFADVITVKDSDLVDVLTEEKKDRLERLSGTWKDRLRYGKWVAFTGTVLDNFKPEIHIVRRPQLWIDRWDGFPPPSWRRVMGIDFGYNPDPWAAVWLARDPEGRYFLYRQDVRLKLTLTEQAARIRRWESIERAHLKACAKRLDLKEGGHAHWDEARRFLGPSRISVARFSDHDSDARAMFTQEGVPTWPADKEVFAGIEHLRDLLNPANPRLFIVADSLVERDPILRETQRPTCAQEEVNRYVWATRKTAGGGKSMKDVPADGNDHAWDAIRYALFSSRRGMTRVIA